MREPQFHRSPFVLRHSPCPRRRTLRPARAFTLIELLCVIAIIGILLSLLLPAVFRAYHRVKDMADQQEAPEVAHLLRKQARGYCAGHPQYRFDSKSDFADKCEFSPKCRDWVERSGTDFVPFDFNAATNAVVLTVYVGSKRATVYYFSKGELSIPADQ